MSTRVYLSKNTCQITPSEDTPVCIRIQRSRATVKDLHRRLQHAYQCDDVRLVRWTTVLIDLLVHHVPVAVLSERWGLSPACLYGWQQALLLRGMDSVVSRHGGGRRPQLTPRPHSTEFNGGACHRSSKASRGEDWEIEEPVLCGHFPAFHFHATLPRMQSEVLIWHQVVQVRQPREKRLLAPRWM